ncbi:hypothetical protein GUITHDRAFT_152599 [Guillardia theta CCMP2712]|uniref:Uncharacterized protein n=1 Tax=Guillardia theta (strain CCMP2712) TaxID=905079 RepID=L1JCQ5_GUITC|nr:hypothetical protein GUITHDRAFT_152599 [Guillardia theta CCMP2712]EKX45904.1 hypothetical protein GUITHDRAFT_152599 [Guillardia theta CCMP2712]|eukprot:XP_005832884.1 hypothetical protein GUITHDRAFT_152599 [Guillardia theta CCMP2712]
MTGLSHQQLQHCVSHLPYIISRAPHVIFIVASWGTADTATVGWMALPGIAKVQVCALVAIGLNPKSVRANLLVTLLPRVKGLQK